MEWEWEEYNVITTQEVGVGLFGVLLNLHLHTIKYASLGFPYVSWWINIYNDYFQNLKLIYFLGNVFPVDWKIMSVKEHSTTLPTLCLAKYQVHIEKYTYSFNLGKNIINLVNFLTYILCD